MTAPRKTRWQFHPARVGAGILFVTLAVAVWWCMPVVPWGTLPKGLRILDLSSDGRVLATREEGRITFWDMANLQIAGRMPDDPKGFRKFMLSPNGRWFVATEDGLIKLWEVPTGRERDAVRCEYNYIHSIDPCFSPDGKWLAIGIEGPMEQGLIKIWDLEKGSEHALLTNTRLSPVWRMSPFLFSPDGKTLLFNRNESKPGGPFVSRLCFWDNSTGLERQLMEAPHRLYRCTAFSPDSRTLATDDGLDSEEAGPGGVKLWDVATGKLLRFWRFTQWVDHLWFTVDGTRLLATSTNNLTVINPASPVPEKQRPIPPIPYFSQLSPDRRLLVCLPTYSRHHWEHVWLEEHPNHPPTILSLPELRERSRLEPVPGDKRLYLGKIAPNGKLLAAGTRNGSLRRPRRPFPTLSSLLEQVGLRDRWFTSWKQELYLYSTDTGRCQGAVPADSDTDVWFGPDGRTLVVLGPDYTPTIWDLPLGKPWGRIFLYWAALAASFAAVGLWLRRRKRNIPAPALPPRPASP
jgi:WD40 repeat protein